MNILLVHQYFLEKNQGGGSRWNEMVREWVSLGYQITVIAGMVHYNTGLKEERYKGKYFFVDNYDNDVKVIRCHVSESYNKNFLGRLWGYFSFTFSSILGGIFRAREKYDVVIVSSPPLFIGLTGLILKSIKKIPLVFEVRDLWPESAIDTGVVKNKTIIKLSYGLERYIYKHSDLINTLTPAFQKHIVEKKSIEKSKVIMIPNAADLTLADSVNEFDIQTFRKSKGWEGKFVFLYVGAHGIANDLIQLVDVADKLNRKDVHFVCIGSGMQKEYLKSEVNRRDLFNIEFLDPVSKLEVFKYIKSCDVGVSILKKLDTFKTIYSNKTFDYFSCSKPVLMVIDGVSRELIENAKAGLYSEPENIEMLIKTITELISDKDRLINMGKNGREYVSKYFDRNILAKEYIEIIRNRLTNYTKLSTLPIKNKRI